MGASAYIRAEDDDFIVAENNLAFMNVHSSVADTSGAAGLYLTIWFQLAALAWLKIWRL